MSIPSIPQPSNPKVLLNKIAREFPWLHWSNYQYIDQGWDHEVIILDNSLVFRFPINPEYLNLLKHEAAVLDVLHPLVSIRIPKFEYISSDYTFAGYQYIHGDTLYLDAFNTLDKVSHTLIVKQLAGFLTLIHNQDPDRFEKLGVPVTHMKIDQSHVKQQAQKHLSAVLNKEEMDDVSRILESVDSALEKELPHVFLHGDIYSTHLLWDKSKRKLGLLDFSDMNIGDPAFDFAELFEYGSKFVEEVYKLYTGPKDDTFLDRAWIYQCWVGVFMMINYFETKKTTFVEARKTFDRCKI